MGQKIFLYNTATRSKEEFKPLQEGKVGIYSCGPTVYWNQHIGNMYAFLVWDVLVRSMKFLGYEAKWVMNITDVGHMTSDGDTGDDKMEKGALREGISVWEIGKKYEKQFEESLDLLNIRKPDVLCRATEHIPEQIELAEKIDDNGYAYKTKTGLVYDTAKFKDYAKFANLKLDEMDTGARVEVDEEKKNPWDFLLWVTNQPKHIMKWPSPWGEGFPGWHLECTAMSTKYLGETFDIHTGGIEHIGVHHTNEIAQGYGAFGHQTANYWMHNAWLTLKEGKMSKSLGNVYTVQQLVEMSYHPLALRYLVLTTHYRKGLVFSLESLKVAEAALNKLRTAAQVGGEGKLLNNVVEEFKEKIADDLAMPEAMAVVWKMVKGGDRKEDIKLTLLELDKVLGLDLEKKLVEEEASSEVKMLAEERMKAKDDKNWLEADRLRAEVEKMGYQIEDGGSDGYKLKKA